MANKYRTHHCAALRKSDVGAEVKLSGWVHRKRDHGGLLFIDLRDNYGITQCVVSTTSEEDAATYAAIKLESVIQLSGKVVERSAENVNKHIDTGEVEVVVRGMEMLGAAGPLPMPVNGEEEYPEDIRLKYRFLDLRRTRLHNNIILRSKVISYLRSKMIEQGFLEFQTPILTASSPEGARDFLVPSRLHPGKFYALPQAPQIFKQLLMVSGFDRYFQIATCFRDEDGRADRSPTEFYQLDFEMSFVEQDDIFNAIEPVLHGVFSEFGNGRAVSEYPFKRIPYEEAMLKYGSDKPDLRNPIEIVDVTDIFSASSFEAFKKQIALGGIVRAVPVPGIAGKPRSFWDGMNAWAIKEGAPGLGYLILEAGAFKGPIAKFLSDDNKAQLIAQSGIKEGEGLFFVCGTKAWAPKFAGNVRKKLGEDLELLDKNVFKFCWIVDFPMYELNEDTGKVDFSHNPFSMPQGGMDALLTQDPLDIKAFQYDIVCNGYELSSGAIRNHVPDIMYKAFELAGYTRADVEQKFGGLLNAFKYGAPPHGGSAPGIDRIVMLLADEPNLREVIAFPTNQQGEDLLLNAPTFIEDERLKELHIVKIKPPAKKAG